MHYKLLRAASLTGVARTVAILTVVSVAAIGFAVSPSAQEKEKKSDPILESFERDAQREPTPAAPIRRDMIEKDELYDIINTIHWTRDDAKEPAEDETARKAEDEITKNDS